VAQLPNWVVNECVQFVSPVAAVREPFQMNDQYLRQFPQVKLLGGLLVLLTCRTIPTTIRQAMLKLHKLQTFILVAVFYMNLRLPVSTWII